MKKTGFIFMGLCMLIALNLTSAIYVEDNNTILNMDHAIRVQKIETNPQTLSPGDQGILTITLKNNARYRLDDLIIRLNLPGGIKPLNDVDTFKTSRLEPLDSVNASFNIIVSPSASEGIHEVSLLMSYISYLGTNFVNIGEQKTDNSTFGIIIRGEPDLFSQIESSEIYAGKNMGEVTIKFINKGTGDIKFLTINLLESGDYDIISGNQDYVGDLDSDDFDSADFRIKAKNKDRIELLLKAEYKDSLNEKYSKEFRLPLEIRSAKELGIKTNGISKTVGVLIILAIAGYFIYKKYKKSKKIKTI